MIKSFVVGFFGLSVACVACANGATSPEGTGRLALDVRCAQDSDCPTSFQCEIEDEHGVSQSYCVADQSSDASATQTCPPGFEAEVESNGTLCKVDHSADGAGGSDDATSGTGVDDSSGTGIDDTSSSSSGGSVQTGGACATSADCASGLECEVQIEHGVTSMVCKAHGGNP